jgi:hypothetical protein
MAVYHDDLMDYSTNEPTMDGTASAILMFALLSGEDKANPSLTTGAHPPAQVPGNQDGRPKGL